MLGSLGPVIFTVSEKQVRTLQGLTRTESGRWAKHDIVGRKPVPEFLGPDLSGVSFSIRFDIMLGMNPKKETNRLIGMSRDGKAYHFILGTHRFGVNKWSVQDVKVDFERIDNRGNVLIADVSITLEEYP